MGFVEEVYKSELKWLGVKEYEEALTQQILTADAVRKGAPARILACQHPTVITMGKRAENLNDVLVSMETLRSRNIKIVGTDRGGQATLHNPGQLVLYPILPLMRWGVSVRHYVEVLERTTALFLAEYGVAVGGGKEPGLWVGENKIASFGIRVDRGVSHHGTAINISNDLRDFELIKSCGQKSRVTHLNNEMAEFAENLPVWDFHHEALRWRKIFIDEMSQIKNRKEEVLPEIVTSISNSTELVPPI